MKILADASLPVLPNCFPYPFELTLYHHQDEIPELLSDQDILLCRSTLLVNESLIKNHSLRFIATASSGIDHIDETFLKTRNINIIDAKGSNANAVADYVLATIAYLQKYRSFKGKRAGIIGVGAVGTKVLQRLNAINFDVIYYDPLRSNQEEGFTSSSLTEIMASDLICIHANLHDTSPHPTRNLIAKDELSLLNKDTVIINASRGGIVSESALLNLDTRIMYCTDVFANEPTIDPQLVEFASLVTPHIAGHSLEAKMAAVIMVSQKLHHCYNLPLPSYPELTINQSHFFNAVESWQDYVLSLYNPIHETLALKQALNKKDSFLQLRKAHQTRHDFNAYDRFVLGKELRTIFGLI